MHTTHLQIDREHTEVLLRGDWIAIKVPRGSDIIRLRLKVEERTPDSIAKWLDVFFNGRKA